MPFEPQACFTHPIEQEQARLLNDFMNSMQLLSSKQMMVGTLTLTDTRVQNTQATFMFSYEE